MPGTGVRKLMKNRFDSQYILSAYFWLFARTAFGYDIPGHRAVTFNAPEYAYCQL
jgi:hypothetical protein